MKYIITKRQCKKQIEQNNNICSGCGKKLTPIKTVDNADNPTYWIGCQRCCKFDFGVKKEHYKIARLMVLSGEYRNSYLEYPDSKNRCNIVKYYYEQISDLSRLVTRVLYLNKIGVKKI